MLTGQTIDESRDGLARAYTLGDRWLISNAHESLAWQLHAHDENTEAITLAEEGLALAYALGDRWQIHRVLFQLGRLRVVVQGDLATARALHEESLAFTRALGNRLGIASALNGLAEVAEAQGDFAATQTLHQERLLIERELGNKAGVANALAHSGFVACAQGDYALGRDILAQSLTLYRELGAPRSLIWFLVNRAHFLALEQGDYVQGNLDLAEALSIARGVEDKYWVGWILRDQGITALAQGDMATATLFLEESRALEEEVQHGPAGSKWLIASVLEGLGQLARRQGDHTAAVSFLRESLRIQRSLSYQNAIADHLLHLGHALLAIGDLDDATNSLTEGLVFFRRSGMRQRVAWSLEGLAGVAAAQGRSERAARLWGAAAMQRERIGTPMWSVDRADYTQRVAAARAALTPEDFDTAWAEGQAMTLEQAVAEALGEAG